MRQRRDIGEALGDILPSSWPASGGPPTDPRPWMARLKRAMTGLGMVVALHGSVSQAQADIIIGLAGPMSGPSAVFGEQMTRGAQAAVDRINANGGINGEQLALVTADDACDTRRALAAAASFVAKDVRFVVGHFCSGAALATAETYGKADIIMLSPTASQPKLTEEGRWNVLRLASRDDAQGQFAALRIAKDAPGAKIAVVLDNTPGTAALAATFAGIAPIVIKPGDKAFPAAVAAIKSSGATVVYLATAAAEAGILAGALQDALVTAKLYGPDSLLADVFWERAGVAAEGALVTFTRDATVSPKAQSLIAFLAAADVATDGATLPAYAAVEIFAAAAKAKSVNDGKAMASWMKSGLAIETVLGAVSFDSKGDVTPQQFDWYRWSQGLYSREQ